VTLTIAMHLTLCLCVGGLLAYTHPVMLAIAALALSAAGLTTGWALAYIGALLLGAVLMVTAIREPA
jgi:hypothetical protein